MICGGCGEFTTNTVRDDPTGFDLCECCRGIAQAEYEEWLRDCERDRVDLEGFERVYESGE